MYDCAKIIVRDGAGYTIPWKQAVVAWLATYAVEDTIPPMLVIQ